MGTCRPRTGEFSQLNDKGLVLGVDDTYRYKNSITGSLSHGDIMLIGTDGISETRNDKEQTFGTDQLETVIAKILITHLELSRTLKSIPRSLQR